MWSAVIFIFKSCIHAIAFIFLVSKLLQHLDKASQEDPVGIEEAVLDKGLNVSVLPAFVPLKYFKIWMAISLSYMCMAIDWKQIFLWIFLPYKLLFCYDGQTSYCLPGYMVQLVEVQQLRGAVGGDLFCCLLTEEPPEKKDSKSSIISIQILLTGLHTFLLLLVGRVGSRHVIPLPWIADSTQAAGEGSMYTFSWEKIKLLSLEGDNNRNWGFPTEGG